jgi:hypothetical protein
MDACLHALNCLRYSEDRVISFTVDVEKLSSNRNAFLDNQSCIFQANVGTSNAAEHACSKLL